MKVVAKPIEVISHTDTNGEVRPIRFRLTNEDETFKVIKIDKIIVKETEKLAGNVMLVYKCQSLIDEIKKIYEIKYELRTCK
jgi:ribosomal protein S28E/S33